MGTNLEKSLSSIALLGGIERILLVAVILYGMWRAMRRANLQPHVKLIAGGGITITLIAWLSAVWVFALNGALQTFAGTSPGAAIALILTPIIFIVSAVLFFAARSPVITAILDAAPLPWLIGVQVYRILGVVFIRLWLAGLVPGFFGLCAGVGDILVGLCALPVAIAVRSNSSGSRKAAYIWNFGGMLDLINAVGMGAATVILGHGQLAGNGASPLLMYPIVMVPAFGVPLAFILHGLSVRQLQRRSRISYPAHLHEEDEMTEAANQNPISDTTGLVIHWPARYDLLVWLITLGRERVFREKLVNLAQLEAGESVLDIGCGTGSLAIAAKRRVGQSGTVIGIDASPEMLVRARKKAMKAGANIEFRNDVAEALSFHDAQFDAVLSTVMLHHLPDEARKQCAREIRRVLKPGGRLLAVDFGGAPEGRRSLIAHFHRHAIFDLREAISVFEDVGLRPIESGAVGLTDLQFVLAR
jgi:ubiquinone/menaquinone biosynthesis C-methylase UbiE